MHGNKSPARPVFSHILTFILFLTVFITFLLAGCSGTPLPDRLAEGKAWQATCPTGQNLALLEEVDASGSQRHAQMSDDLKQIVRDGAARTAVCGGRFRVEAFAGSSTGTAILFDRPLSLPQATQNAKFLAVKGVQDDAVEEVSVRYEEISGLTSGSDVIAQARLASEFINQLGPEYHLALTVISDGAQNVGPVNPATASTPQIAEKLAAQADVPLLTGAEITFVGLGNTNGATAPSKVAENIVNYYTALCHRMAAGKCTVATDYTSPVGGDRR